MPDTAYLGLILIIVILVVLLIWLTLIYRKIIQESLQVGQSEKVSRSPAELKTRLIKENQDLVENFRRESTALLTQVTQAEVDAYREKLKGLGRVAEGKLDDYLIALSRETKTKLTVVLEEVKKQIAAEARIHNAEIYDSYAKDLEEQKQKRLAKLDAEIYAITKKTVKSVLGETLDLSKQEELVFRALKDAKDKLLS